MVKLNVYMKGLAGTLSIAIGGLGALTWLSLSHNSLSGPLPSQLGLLTNLQTLALSSNQFTSAVPASFCDLSKSIDLQLQSNALICLPSCLTTGSYVNLQKDSALTVVCRSSPSPTAIPTPASTETSPTSVPQYAPSKLIPYSPATKPNLNLLPRSSSPTPKSARTDDGVVTDDGSPSLPPSLQPSPPPTAQPSDVMPTPFLVSAAPTSSAHAGKFPVLIVLLRSK